MGVSAVFYVTLVLEKIPEEREKVREVAEGVVYFVSLPLFVGVN